MSIWQFIGYAAAATGVAIGVTALACEGIVRFLDWLYPDAPDLANGLVVAVTETSSAEDVESLANALETELAA